jgi:hypothetical protein
MNWPRHPVPVRCLFRHCLLVTFAVEPEALARALPPHITPDIFDDRAWLSVVIGNMQDMRPVGVPAALGVSYDQIVYRAVVRCQGQRGVHFLRSDANRRAMCALGDRMSFFRFHHAAIDIEEIDATLAVSVAGRRDPVADIEDRFDLAAGQLEPPETSRFPSAAEAQPFLVDLFTAYDYNPRLDTIDIVRIDRGEWHPRYLPATAGRYRFMETGPWFETRTAEMDSVIHVGHVPYRWHRLERRRAESGASDLPTCYDRHRIE